MQPTVQLTVNVDVSNPLATIKNLEAIISALGNAGKDVATPVAAKKTRATKATPVVEKAFLDEEEEDDDIDFDNDDDEAQGDEDEEDAVEESDDEESEEEDEGEEDEEEEAPKQSAKSRAKPAVVAKGKATTAKPVKATKVSLLDVQRAFAAAHSTLVKRLKSKDKAAARLNALLKKHGAKNTRTLEFAKYSNVMKELQTLTA